MSRAGAVDEFDLLNTRIQPGLNVIEAGAGTGKTWSISHLVPRLLIKGDVERLDQILMVSFTDEATRELAERVRAVLAGLVQALLDQDPRPDQAADLPGLLERARRSAEARGRAGEAILLKALSLQAPEDQGRRLRALLAARLDADRLVVSTIHALCKRILGDEGFLCSSPSGFEVATDLSEARRRALSDVWRRDLAPDPMLAGLAEAQGWKLDDDAKAWRLLEPTDGEELYPVPPSLPQAKAALTDLLAALRVLAGGLPGMEALLRGLTLNKAGKDLDFKGMAARLEALDPGAPSAQDLALLETLSSPQDWIRKAGKANLAARARIGEGAMAGAAVRAQSAVLALQWAWRGHALAQARGRLDAGLKDANSLSYNDLIARVDRALAGSNGEELARRLRSRWKLALVDESQDTDRRQLAIFEAVFNRPGELDTALVLIGDPKQSIYGFRGADLAAYEGVRDREGVPLHRLTLTHRSARGLVQALNRLFASPDPLASPALAVPEATAAKDDSDLPLPVGETRRLIASLVDERDSADWQFSAGRLNLAAQAAAAALSDLLGRPLPHPGAEKSATASVLPGDCAVLTRDRRQALAMRQALADLGIPSVVRDDSDVLAGEAASELHSLLQALLSPGQRGLRRAALATRLLGLDAARLDALAQTEEDAWAGRMLDWGLVWRERGIAALLARLDAEAGVSLRLAGLSVGERLLTDLRHLGELLQAEEAERRLAPMQLLRWFRNGMAEADGPGQASALHLRRLEADGSAVQVLTVHRAKGLEFDYCFLPFLWDAKAPDASDPRVVRLPGGGRALADPRWLDPGERERLHAEGCWQSLEESLRLAYVALTRARRRIWLLAGWIGYAGGASTVEPSALDWLLRVPREGESGPQWYARMVLQKRPAARDDGDAGARPLFHCEHRDRLEALAAGEPGIGVQGPPAEAKPWKAAAGVGERLGAEAAPPVPLSWRVTSFSALAGGGGGPRSRFDPDRDDGATEGPALPLSAFTSSSRAGECLHEVLEHWDFKTPPAHLQATLRRHGFDQALADGQDPRALLERELPRWARAELPGLGPLALAASDAGLSEWHFVLPLGPRGLDGPALARAFAAHADPRLRAYAAALAALAPDAVHGMLQGYIDRLVRVGGAWGLVDWKSNKLGEHAGDFSEARMFEEAVSHHYVLQLHFYLLALRRHLRARGGDFRLAGASLVFLRALEPGSRAGILHFDADPACLDRLDALFAGGRA
jgi:exodeoxyribonuclease V beta subunit